MLNLQLDWDRPNQLCSQSFKHTLRLRLLPNAPTTRTLPLHLGLLLDTSQSMQGEKLTAAKQACKEILKHLRPGDTLSLASYSAQVTTLLQQVQNNNNQSDHIIEQLKIESVTRTDLALNWLLNTLQPQSGVISVGILVTDGHATTNQGQLLEDLNPLITQAETLAQQGIILCTVGLGNAANFNTQFLVNLSDRGRGAFIYADEPEVLSRQLQERLIACQSIAIEEIRLQLKPCNGATIEGFCRLRPEYLPLEETAPNQLTLSAIRGNEPTDILISVNVPALTFSESPCTKTFLEVELVAPNLAPLQGETSIQYTHSYSEAQQINRQVNEDRLLWIINQCSSELPSSQDPQRTGQLLVDLQVAALKSGQDQIAASAAQQLADLNASGKLNAHSTADLLQATRKLGGQQ